MNTTLYAKRGKVLAVFLFSLLLLSRSFATFNVIGEETKTTFDFLFQVSEPANTALMDSSWDSATDMYQHTDSDVVNMTLMYWNITFSYAAATKMVTIEAYHKIDPHNDAMTKGGTFKWSFALPTPTINVGQTGATRGFANMSGPTVHIDSLSPPNHSDFYEGSAAYTEDQPLFNKPGAIDILAVELTGEHREKPVPDASSSGVMLLFVLGLFVGARSMFRARRR